LREASKGKPKMHPLLATAGIKSIDWDQHLTPLAWKLLQQQHLELAQSPQLQQQGIKLPHAVRGSEHVEGAVSAPVQSTQQHREVSAAAVFGGSAASSQKDQPQVLQKHQGVNHKSRQPARSPHRRSFDMPGRNTAGGFSAAFGARRQHVAHMMTEAQDLSRRSLLGAQLGGLVAGAGSRRGSLDRSGLTLEVATSLAGALPGCVSDKLGQYLQAYGVASEASRVVSNTASHGGDGTGVVVAVVEGELLREGRRHSISRRSSLRGECGARSSAETCAVCMDQECAVAMVGCGHSLCFTCAGCIVGQVLGVRPPLCPFCRTAIRGTRLLHGH
jgi:hypothetical protein